MCHSKCPFAKMGGEGGGLEMMTLLDKSQMIRLHIQGMSNREIGRTMGVSRNTVGKYIREYERLQSELEACDPDDTEEVRRITDAITAEPAYDCSSRGCRKWNAEMDALLDEILAAEEEKRAALGPNKQALTKAQIHALIVAEGHDIGLTTVSRRVDEKRSAGRDAFIAQRYEYGDRFEYDFGEVKLHIGGRLRRIQMAVMVACASDVRFALLYESQRQDVFLDSQVRFFEFMGGTFREGAYDNMRNVVSRFVGRSEKELNPELLKLAAYYGFAPNVCNCFSGWEKGAVESAVKVVRNRAFALEWRFDTLADAQAHLDAVLSGLNEGKDLEAERRALRPLPPRYEVADVREGCRVDKYSCVTVDGSRYSVPEGLVGKRATVRAYPNEVLVDFGGANVASHARARERGAMVLDVRHYLRTLERKPGALARSEVLAGYPTFKRIFDDHYSGRPKEFIEIVRAHADEGQEALEAELMACAAAGGNQASRRASSAIAEAASSQVERMAGIWRVA